MFNIVSCKYTVFLVCVYSMYMYNYILKSVYMCGYNNSVVPMITFRKGRYAGVLM